MKMFRCRDANRLCSVASALLILLLVSTSCHATDIRRLWQSRDQFVALESQDAPRGGSVILNDHPVEISPDRLTAMLSSIEVRTEDNKKPGQLITVQSLEVLVPELVKGFHEAAPNQDVTFAVIGLHRALYGFAKTAKVTTGRAFFKGGRLNIIFGLVQKDVNERDDRRLVPFTPGSRQDITVGEWTLLPQPDQPGYSLIRNDWVTFNNEWRAPAAQIPVPDQNVPASQISPVPSGKQQTDTLRPADRLATLKELKDKGLISEDEYRSKRMEILNGL
jgi:hypothetical protein